MAAVIDPRQLSSLVDDVGDLEFVVMTVELYLSELAPRRDEIVTALTNGRLIDCRDLTHSLASASALVGAAQLSALCRFIEIGVETELTKLPTPTDFAAACERAEEGLRGWIAGQGSNR